MQAVCVSFSTFSVQQRAFSHVDRPVVAILATVFCASHGGFVTLDLLRYAESGADLVDSGMF